ncbi:MAG: hypothetical protein CMK23_01115 [Porticoccaceae bacterium]|nr:hypothetical protein [Porticoccaceae bacterium]|tara:strand:+ start:23 stop:904 length:882 start_codon:yes stop_codon:yes gene_type:complete
MKPRSPIYIPSKGRYENPITAKHLDLMNVPYQVIVEEQEFDLYARSLGEDKLLVLPKKYLDEYDTFWKDDDPRKGPGGARNYAWDHSIAQGHDKHWVMDDNIAGFCRFNRNERINCRSGAIFRASEDFVDRYENIAMSGFEYRFFAGGSRRKKPPYRTNTRIYSCNLIRNDVPYRWRGRYNEDTDLSLRMLKDGWATLLFQAFLQNKLRTSTMRGGNSAEFYDGEGTKNKSQMLVDMHPEITSLVFRYGRWHHEVDYSSFKDNPLKKIPGLEIPDGINEYGMKLVKTRSKNYG